jgi:acyl carrier protein
MTTELPELPELHDQVRHWIRSRNKRLASTLQISPDLDLLENRLIDSLGFVDFILFLEDLTGVELRGEAQASVDSFRTLALIEQTIARVREG